MCIRDSLRAALAGSSDQLGGVALDEVTVPQELAHGVHKAALCLEHELVLVGAQVDPAVITNPSHINNKFSSLIVFVFLVKNIVIVEL